MLLLNSQMYVNVAERQRERENRLANIENHVILALCLLMVSVGSRDDFAHTHSRVYLISNIVSRLLSREANKRRSGARFVMLLHDYTKQ